MITGEIVTIKKWFHADDFEPFMNEKGYNELQAYTHWIKKNIGYDFKIIDFEVEKVEHVLYGCEYKFKSIIRKL